MYPPLLETLSLQITILNPSRALLVRVLGGGSGGLGSMYILRFNS